MVGCCGQGGRAQAKNVGGGRRDGMQDDVEYADREWIGVNREVPVGGGGGLVCVCAVTGGRQQQVQGNVRRGVADDRSARQVPGTKRRCVTDPHDEEVCHGTNERRRDLIDQVKIFLDEFDERPCQSMPTKSASGGLRPLGDYDVYNRKHCQSWMPPNPRPPLITSVATHEIRPTEDYEKMSTNNNEYVTFTDARVKPPPLTCDCAKRNGLQDQCPRPECTPPTPQCLATNPGPCCPPSLGLTAEEAARGWGPAGASSGHTGSSRGHTGSARGHTGTSRSAADCYITVPAATQPQMVCFCEATPTNMPCGKKYICCPVPLQ